MPARAWRRDFAWMETRDWCVLTGARILSGIIAPKVHRGKVPGDAASGPSLVADWKSIRKVFKRARHFSPEHPVETSSDLILYPRLRLLGVCYAKQVRPVHARGKSIGEVTSGTSPRRGGRGEPYSPGESRSRRWRPFSSPSPRRPRMSGSGGSRRRSRSEHDASLNAQGLQAPDRAQNFRTYFDCSGIRVHDRTSSGSSKLLGLTVVALGRGETFVPVAPGEVVSEGSRVEIRRSGILEWYVNSPEGLEQGFTLPERLNAWTAWEHSSLN